MKTTRVQGNETWRTLSKKIGMCPKLNKKTPARQSSSKPARMSKMRSQGKGASLVGGKTNGAVAET